MIKKMVTPHFSREELQCGCCGGLYISRDFLRRLELLRKMIGRPLIPTSCSRCESHNKRVGGAANSYHKFVPEVTKTRAVDIACTNSRFRYQLVENALEAGFTGIGIYSSFVHLDTRPSHEALMWHGR